MATTHPRIRPPGGGGPPTSPGQTLLDQLVVDDFTVNPLTIALCSPGTPVKVEWRVSWLEKNLPDPPFRFMLQIGTQNISVNAVGDTTLDVPGACAVTLSVEYIDEHGVVQATRQLAMYNITSIIGNSSLPLAYDASAVSQACNPGIEATIPHDVSGYDLTLSRTPQWSIDAGGLHIRLTLAMPSGVRGIPVLDLVVNVTAIAFPDQGQLGVSLVSFTVTPEFPFWEWLLVPWFIAQVETLVSVIILLFQPAIGAAIEQGINNLAPQPIPPGVTIAEVQFVEGAMIVICCLPQGGCTNMMNLRRRRARAALQATHPQSS